VRTADLDTTKLHWNSVISTKGARYMCLDIKNFYLTAELEYYEYMKILLTLFPPWIVEQYDLNRHALHGFVHLEMRRAVWRMPQAGILANKRLRWKLAPFGYHESTNTPSLWYHKSCPITFTMVVDDFGVKYVSKDDVNHLITSIKMDYTITKDWLGDLYCGIQLDWDFHEIPGQGCIGNSHMPIFPKDIVVVTVWSIVCRRGGTPVSNHGPAGQYGGHAVGLLSGPTGTCCSEMQTFLLETDVAPEYTFAI
jgi:hypothetical protein